MVGARIRQERQSQDRSLAEVARKARVSVATLSRIENGKQTLDLGMFLTLARVLNVSPHDLLDDDPPGADPVDPLVRRIAGLGAADRIRLWRELAEAQRQRRGGSRRADVREIAHQVDELLAHFDFLRQELEAVRDRLRRR